MNEGMNEYLFDFSSFEEDPNLLLFPLVRIVLIVFEQSFGIFEILII